MGLLRTIFHYASFGIVDSNEQVKRKNTPFCFPYKMSESDFRDIAEKTAAPVKRLKLHVNMQYVKGTVLSQSGINTWYFEIDFNDFGTITGRYWMSYIENNDSQIPHNYAKRLSEAIIDYLKNGN